MLDLDKQIEKWFEKKIGAETCEFLLRYYSPEKRIEHEKACTVKSKGKSKRDDKKYVTMMANWIVQDWKDVGCDCNAENRKKFAENYAPAMAELLDLSIMEGAFREYNTLELVKNYVGLSYIPSNGGKVKAEIDQD